jgi:predicted transcriptional regulator
LSIKPAYVSKIFDGDKKFEYRRKIGKAAPRKVFVYSSSPVCRVVGELIVGDVISADPAAVWRKTKAMGGVTYAEFSTYFAGVNEAHALSISSVKIYAQPITLNEAFGLKRPPQSYMYV